MAFQRIFPLLVLLILAGACTPETNPPQTAVGGVAGMPRDIEKEVGPAYSSPGLQAMVNRVGQKLVTSSGLSGSYRFYVLDQPVANAHAMSSGYVFVTRGLLALMNDEAELAAAMGHELGHIALKHAAQREQARKGVLDSAVDAALKSGSMRSAVRWLVRACCSCAAIRAIRSWKPTGSAWDTSPAQAIAATP